MKADHTFTGRVLRLTSAAVLILPYDDEGEEKPEEEKVWLPLSQILDRSEELEPQAEVTLTIPRWLAQEKDMM